MGRIAGYTPVLTKICDPLDDFQPTGHSVVPPALRNNALCVCRDRERERKREGEEEREREGEGEGEREGKTKREKERATFTQPRSLFCPL